MTYRVCGEPGCPELFDKTQGTRCPRHRAAHERRRGTRTERGYDNTHVRLRAWWAPKVARGNIPCAKCGQPITTGSDWHLGHNNERTAHTGPEHVHCNLSEAGRKAHR